MPLKIVTLFVLSVFFISCAEDKIIQFSEVNITTPNNTIVEINVPMAQGNGKIPIAINNTLKQIISKSLQLNPELEDDDNSIENNIDRFNAEYKTFKEQFEDSAQEWEAQIDGEVLFQSPELISMSLTSYSNTGGAHGILVVRFLNFNASTGALIPNDQLFTNEEKFKQLALPYFNDEIKSKVDILFEADTFQLPKSIGYSSDGLILFYNAYEIAPYSSGITEFVIPYNKANSYLKFKGF